VRRVLRFFPERRKHRDDLDVDAHRIEMSAASVAWPTRARIQAPLFAERIGLGVREMRERDARSVETEFI
jgi:hypothetical protein